MSERPGKGLGMGLQALLGEARPAPSDASVAPGGVREIEIARIKPNPNQPRTHFDEEALDELAQSIRERGLLQPILVRPEGDNFQIVAGERRSGHSCIRSQQSSGPRSTRPRRPSSP